MKNCYKTSCKESAVGIADKTAEGLLTSIRTNKSLGCTFDKKPGKLAPQRFWSKFIHLTNFWWTYNQGHVFQVLQDVKFQALSKWHANKELCEKITIWNLMILQFLYERVKMNESVSRSGPDKMIIDAVDIIITMKPGALPTHFDKQDAKKIDGFDFPKSATNLPWKTTRIEKYLAALNEQAEEDAKRDNHNQLPTVYEESDLDDEDYENMGFDADDRASPRDESYGQRQTRIIAKIRQNLYSKGHRDNMTTSEKKLHLWLINTYKTQLWIKCVVQAKIQNWICYVLNIGTRWREEQIYSALAIDDFNFGKDPKQKKGIIIFT